MWKKTVYRFTLDTISSLPIVIKNGERIFLRGDLGTGKTTLVKHLLQPFLPDNSLVKSPTYVYYNKYGANIYHFDLYRLGSYDEFVNIGGEEILDDPDNICIIEWPELLERRYIPTLDVQLRKVEGDDMVREAEITEA